MAKTAALLALIGCPSLSLEVVRDPEFLVADSSVEVPAIAGEPIKLWPGAAPGDVPGQFGPEFTVCLTPNTSVADCKGTLLISMMFVAFDVLFSLRVYVNWLANR